jgi:hypothetical protein
MLINFEVDILQLFSLAGRAHTARCVSGYSAVIALNLMCRVPGRSPLIKLLILIAAGR